METTQPDPTVEALRDEISALKVIIEKLKAEAIESRQLLDKIHSLSEMLK
jgi:hypothetical protein